MAITFNKIKAKLMNSVTIGNSNVIPKLSFITALDSGMSATIYMLDCIPSVHTIYTQPFYNDF